MGGARVTPPLGRQTTTCRAVAALAALGTQSTGLLSMVSAGLEGSWGGDGEGALRGSEPPTAHGVRLGAPPAPRAESQQ